MGEVRLVDIGKRFRLSIDRKEHVVTALDGVNLTIADGEIVMLTGPSGCGKTTALRIVMGLERASTGRVLVGGRETRGCGYDRGMVFQHAELLPWLTALENVMFGLEMKGVRGAELRTTAGYYLEMVGLSGSANRRPHQLSGGMKQRVGIARALAIDPDVLLMDEPFGALDAQTRETLQAQLLEIHARTGKTILFVTHDLDEAVLLGDRVVVMGHGTVREIVDVPLARPRSDVDAIRGDALFAQTRHRIWRSLHEGTRNAPEAVLS
jgi:NitT/TauT family transport system ATP-binding protein